VPALVREVLHGPGQPLDSASRAFFEPRFGRDFSRVRVHTDARAAESAQAIHALAYTVGEHLVFDAGQYAPETLVGRRLLAHELTHAVQQGPLSAGFLGTLRLDEPGAREREAEEVAARVALGGHAGPVTAAVAAPVLQKQDGGSPGPADKGICGPDLTTPTKGAVSVARTKFASWSKDQKADACFNLINLNQFPGTDRRTDGWTPIAAISWDIPELHHQGWLKDYRSDCATFSKTPTCGFFDGDPGFTATSKPVASVQIDSSCHYAGSVNYVIFGVMCRLCYDHYMHLAEDAQKELKATAWWHVIDEWRLSEDMKHDIDVADEYNEGAMARMVWAYKGKVPVLRDAAANYEASQKWAEAGYNGWPGSASTPSGDRPNCDTNACPHAYGSVGPMKGSFHVNWYPHGWTSADPALGP
jgi:hypothetical protein